MHDKNYHADHLTSPCCGEKGQAYSEQSHNDFRLTHDEISLPAAVIKQSALENNLQWMQRFANKHQVKLCPHGKTTMTPNFFRQQLEHGAWGITIATAAQAQIAAQAGAKNIIMANQLVGAANMAIISGLLSNQDIHFYCCVDSARNVDALNAFFAQHNQTLTVLIEFGVPGGRCGCRSEEDVVTLAKHIATQTNIKLAGVEVYEGVIHGDNAETRVREFVNATLNVTKQLVSDGLITGKPMVTGAGSAWYDVVAECFAHLVDFDAVIRPGCYIAHDTGIYMDAQNQVMQRAQQNQGTACEIGGDLESALEVWAHILSKPEQGKMVAGLGKRDVAFDAGLPIAQRAYRNGQPISVKGMTSIAVMDQHTFIETSAECELDVGDIVAFSTSHPCLTFDKWRSIAICDDDYQVTHWVETRF
ncbi:amino acid deaminase [Vibrio sp. NTOU-M3]|uniref:amino acid deaminase n=1 Tax=Vibrio sp. NTOU-M3 TaxID=3234954 RepID=UPI00349F3B70